VKFKPLALVAATASIIAVFLIFFAQSPRSRLNVMQFSGLAFVAIVAVRTLSGSRASPEPEPKKAFKIPFAGIAIGFAAWMPALACGFISDDFGVLHDAGRGSMLVQLWDHLRYGHVGTFLRPLGFASIYLDYALWGFSPVPYHATNLLLHLASVAAVYFLARNLGAARDVSAVTAGVFAAMPSQAEAVVWVGARFDLLATALTLWAVVSYLYFKKSRSPAAYFAVLLLYLLAMLSKENGFLLPLFLIAIEVITFRAVKIRDLVPPIGLGILTFVYRWTTLSGIGGYLKSGSAASLNIGPKTLEALFVRGPSQLILGLNWTQPPGFFAIGIASLAVAFLVTLGMLSRPSWKSCARIKLGMAWVFLSILPAHFLLMIDAGLTNSRVLYMASAGAALVLGQLIGEIPQRRFRQTVVVALSLLFSLGVFHNIGAWRWTSRLSQQTLSDIRNLEPAPPPQTEFVIAGLPDTVRGVFLFHASLNESLRLAYNRDDISARRDSDRVMDHEDPQRQIHLLWRESSGSLVERQN